MNMRVRQLWAPALSTFLVSISVQFAALSVPQLPPWVFFTRNRVSVVLAPLWMSVYSPLTPSRRACSPVGAFVRLAGLRGCIVVSALLPLPLRLPPLYSFSRICL